jgi:hypothetical protein
MEKCEEEECDH